jgi:hypothetical protein
MTTQDHELSCTTIGAYVVQDREITILRRGESQILYIEGFERSSITEHQLSCTTKGAYVVQDGRDYAA